MADRDKAFLPHLCAAAAASSGMAAMSCSKAAVINLASLMGSMNLAPQTYHIVPSSFSYRVSKAALNMLTVCAALEFQQSEILFAALHPGWVKTDMGGEGGDLEASESAGGLIRVMDSLTEEQNGAFLNYDSTPMPW